MTAPATMTFPVTTTTTSLRSTNEFGTGAVSETP